MRWARCCRRPRSSSINSTCCSTPAPRSTTCAAKNSFGRARSCASTSRETLAVAATLEDRPRVEAPRTPNLVRRESPPVQSVRVAGATRSVVDLQDATRRVEFPERLDQRAPLATPARDGSPRRVPLPSYRGHRRVLRSPRALRRGRVDQHDDQSRPSTGTRDAG